MEPTQGIPSPSAKSLLPIVVRPDETSQATPEAHDQLITNATTSPNSVLGPESRPKLTSPQTIFQADRRTPGISVSDFAQPPNTRRANGSAQSLIRHTPDNVDHGGILESTSGLRLPGAHDDGLADFRRRELDDQDLKDEVSQHYNPLVAHNQQLQE